MTSLRTLVYTTSETCPYTVGEYALQGIDFLVYPGAEYNLFHLCDDLHPDVALLQLPPSQATTALQQLLSRYPRLKVGLMAGKLDVGQARSAIQNGARGYLLCPVPLEELVWPVYLIYQGKIALSPEVTAALLTA